MPQSNMRVVQQVRGPPWRRRCLLQFRQIKSVGTEWTLKIAPSCRRMAMIEKCSGTEKSLLTHFAFVGVRRQVRVGLAGDGAFGFGEGDITLHASHSLVTG